ncbi:MAG TPA: elongation factor P [Patescibacteria group bacterium]|nr:elongation factor P [Patescibacteria group bacterium]
MKINAGNIKKGQFIQKDGDMWQVQKAEFYSPGKGGALMKSRIKNIKTGKTLDFTYKSSETIEVLDVEVIELQYLYKDHESLHFMNERTFEQHTLPLSQSGEIVSFIKEGDKLFVLLHQGVPIAVRPPQSVRLKVTQAQEAVKGDTVTGAKKSVIVETGATVLAPLFIKTGDSIVVNPETGEYIERVGKQYQ